jgi:hypothetical protein
MPFSTTDDFYIAFGRLYSYLFLCVVVAAHKLNTMLFSLKVSLVTFKGETNSYFSLTWTPTRVALLHGNKRNYSEIEITYNFSKLTRHQRVLSQKQMYDLLPTIENVISCWVLKRTQTYSCSSPLKAQEGPGISKNMLAYTIYAYYQSNIYNKNLKKQLK